MTTLTRAEVERIRDLGQAGYTRLLLDSKATLRDLANTALALYEERDEAKKWEALGRSYAARGGRDAAVADYERIAALVLR